MTKPDGGIKSLAQGRTDVFKIDPRVLVIKDGWNSRDFNDPENLEHVDNLAQSIAAVGVKQPLTVFFENGKCYVSDGECRLRGAMRAIEHYKADLRTVPVQTEDRYANEADRLLNQYIRNTGKNFSQIEMSNHFKRLLGLGLAPKQISEKSGLSQARISQILHLQTLPEPVKEMVTKKEVSANTAVAMVKEHGGTEAEKKLKEGLVKAQAEGKTKVTAKHLPTEESLTKEPRSVNMKTALKEAFEKSTIDNSEDDTVVVTFPDVAFEVIRQLLDL